MNNCETIRTQIEEIALGDDYGQLLRAHLTQCDGCRQFEAEQRKLRELVGSLGTVQAPADFDFKLRARMADRSSSRAAGLPWSLNPLVATAAAIVLFSAVIAGITYVNKRSSTQTAVTANPSSTPIQTVSPSPESDHQVATTSNDGSTKDDATRGVPKDRTPKRSSGSATQATNRPRRQIGVSDFSSTGAQTFRTTTQFNSSRVFPIDASLNAVKVSLDDGRGNARTISLPGVSFGSQRVMTTGNQPQQKGLW